MDLAIVILIAVGIGIALGAVGMHHIHSVANAAARAVTIPAGAQLGVLAAPAAAISADLQHRVAALEAQLAATAPKS